MSESKMDGMSRRNFVKGAAVAAGTLGVLAATGCSTGEAASAQTPAETASGDMEILVTSFGTSFDNSRHITIGAIESAIREAYPGWLVDRAFTAQIIIDKLAAGEGVGLDGEANGQTIIIKNLEEALSEAQVHGIKTLVVFPTHLTAGAEYQDIQNALGEVAGNFDVAVIVPPLLSTDEDYGSVAMAVYENTSQYNDGETAFVLLGHGNANLSSSDSYYDKMQETFNQMASDIDSSYGDYYVCTVEGGFQKEDAYALMQASGKEYKRVVLEDLMVVCGDHANNDMAGDEPDSLKSYFEGLGFEVIPVLDGLGQLLRVIELYKSHLADTLSENGLA